MDTSIIIAIVTLVTAPLAAWSAYLINRHKIRVDMGAAVTDSAVDAVTAIKNVMDSLHYELGETKKELITFKQQNKELEVSLVALGKQNEQLIEQNRMLASEVAALKTQMDRFSKHEQAWYSDIVERKVDD